MTRSAKILPLVRFKKKAFGIFFSKRDQNLGAILGNFLKRQKQLQFLWRKIISRVEKKEIFFLVGKKNPWNGELKKNSILKIKITSLSKCLGKF